MDKKDEIIARQMEIIRSMTEQNLRRVGSDLWGSGAPAPRPPAESGEKTEKETQEISAA